MSAPTERRSGAIWWNRTGAQGLPKGFILVGALALGWCAKGATRGDSTAVAEAAATGVASDDTSSQSIADGQRIFRFDTFGDEQFWTDSLHLNEVVEKGVDPTTARHYDRVRGLKLTEQQQRDLVEYLKSQ